MRFVFDTNVIIRATLLPDSVPSQAIIKAEAAGVVLYSEETLLELFQVLERPKLSLYIQKTAIAEFYARVLMNWQHVSILQRVNDCRDKNDNKFLELALNGDANIIVSGDKDLLTMNPYRAISIITPSVFLREFQ